MCQTLVLTLPDFSIPFILETDACEMGVGAVLMQKGRPIAFLSKALGTKNRSMSTYEKELLAIVMAIKKWRHYLGDHEFIIKTDHQSLKFLLEQRITTMLQQKWLSKLMGLNYKIEYKKGKENLVADALSRLPLEKCQATTTIIPKWMEEVELSYQGDPEAQALLSQEFNPFEITIFK